MKAGGRRFGKGERRNQIVAAASTALVRYGAGRASVRLVAKEGGISPGLITHHFGSIEILVAAVCERLGDVILDALSQAVVATGSQGRLSALIAACVRSPLAAPETAAGWVAVTGLSGSMPAVADARQRVVDTLRDRIEDVLRPYAPHANHAAAASALIAILEGFWAGRACGTLEVTSRDAAEMIRDWLLAMGFGEARSCLETAVGQSRD